MREHHESRGDVMSSGTASVGSGVAPHIEPLRVKFLGIDLVFAGAGWIALGFGLRSART